MTKKEHKKLIKDLRDQVAQAEYDQSKCFSRALEGENMHEEIVRLRHLKHDLYREIGRLENMTAHEIKEL